jgi:hypothetical protein
MKKYISTKTEYISTDGRRDYVQPINAVAGANGNDIWDDSPCPSHVCEKEIKEYSSILRKYKIQSRTMSCGVHTYVLVHPDDRDKALQLAKEYHPNTVLFYAV